MTNSISSFKADVLKTGFFSNPAQALSGTVLGLRVTQFTGRPGAVLTLILRGGTNLNVTGSPLVIDDGQVRGINDINPYEENLEITTLLGEGNSNPKKNRSSCTGTGKAIMEFIEIDCGQCKLPTKKLIDIEKASLKQYRTDIGFFEVIKCCKLDVRGLGKGKNPLTGFFPFVNDDI